MRVSRSRIDSTAWRFGVLPIVQVAANRSRCSTLWHSIARRSLDPTASDEAALPKAGSPFRMCRRTTEESDVGLHRFSRSSSRKSKGSCSILNVGRGTENGATGAVETHGGRFSPVWHNLGDGVVAVTDDDPRPFSDLPELLRNVSLEVEMVMVSRDQFRSYRWRRQAPSPSARQ